MAGTVQEFAQRCTLLAFRIPSQKTTIDRCKSQFYTNFTSEMPPNAESGTSPTKTESFIAILLAQPRITLRPSADKLCKPCTITKSHSYVQSDSREQASKMSKSSLEQQNYSFLNYKIQDSTNPDYIQILEGLQWDSDLLVQV